MHSTSSPRRFLFLFFFGFERELQRMADRKRKRRDGENPTNDEKKKEEKEKKMTTEQKGEKGSGSIEFWMLERLEGLEKRIGELRSNAGRP